MTGDPTCQRCGVTIARTTEDPAPATRPDPVPDPAHDLRWVTDIQTVDAIDSGPVAAMLGNPGWRLLGVGIGSAGQTVLTFGWPDPRGTKS